MTFSGDLEHFPLVDIVQLLHSTRKTGTLHLKGPKGESQLVFNDGFFVSANHVNNSVRIGQVLLEMHAISPETLEQALAEQNNAGTARKPLIATLIERGAIDRETAFAGLETLIEMTIVEVLTWNSGEFSLDVSRIDASDEYRYFPEKLHHEILLGAQGILMDALRIYDEKMRDGTLSELFFSSAAATPAERTDNGLQSAEITADLLGLDALDSMACAIPDVFIGLKDSDPADEHRQIVTRELPETTIDQQERLVQFLISSSHTAAATGAPVTALILLTSDEIMTHTLRTVCRQANLFMIATDEESALDIIIEQSLGRDLHPLVLIDLPHAGDPHAAMKCARQKLTAYPQVTVLLATCAPQWQTIGMQALAGGIRTIMPRPCRQCHKDSYILRLIDFLEQGCTLLKSIAPPGGQPLPRLFIDSFSDLKTRSGPPEIAQVLLTFAAVQFERAITFVVAATELIAEKTIGVTGSKAEGPSLPLMFRLPLLPHSIFQEVIETGRLYFGQRSDASLAPGLYRQIVAPRSPKIMVVPLVNRGKVIALIYADFGSRPVTPPQVDLIEAMALYAGSRLDNALYSKNMEKPV